MAAAVAQSHAATPFVTEGNEPAVDRTTCTPAGLQEALDSYGWVFHVGPFSVGRDGVDIRPQLKFGGQVGNFSAEVGMGDVRDGLRFDSGVKAFVEAEGAGCTLDELHGSIRRQLSAKAACLGTAVGRAASSERVDEVLEVAGRMLSSSADGLGSRTDDIARALGFDVLEVDRMLAGETAPQSEASGSGDRPAQQAPMTLKVRASTGLNVSCQMCLGWANTTGYHMVGLGAKATAGVSAGGMVFAGCHHSGVGVKVVLGVSNFTLEYTFPCATRCGRSAKEQAAVESQAPAPVEQPEAPPAAEQPAASGEGGAGNGPPADSWQVVDETAEQDAAADLQTAKA